MLIFDAHLDLAWNALDWNRDLLLPAAEIRRRECELGMTGKGRGEGTVSFPELRRGKVAIFIATLLARVLKPGAVPAFQPYASMEAAYAAAHGQLTYYRVLEQQGLLRWIKDWPARGPAPQATYLRTKSVASGWPGRWPGRAITPSVASASRRPAAACSTSSSTGRTASPGSA